MPAADRTPAHQPIDRVARLLAWVVPAGILVQAILAGQGWFVAQTGLGYTGRRGGVALASSLHVPLGTLLLATSLLVAVLATMQPRPRP